MIIVAIVLAVIYFKKKLSKTLNSVLELEKVMRNKMTKTTHGMSRTPEYNAWSHMKDRCFNPNNKNYLDYGGRGIAVCDRWLNLENFLADMGTKPSPKHSLDRIDNDGDYCPDNCRWATKAEQANNRRYNRLITIGCVTLTIAQWAIEMGFDKNLIYCRLNSGWSEFDAVMTPVHTDKLITIGNKTWTIAQWTEEKGYGKSVIQNRLNDGWSEFAAVMTPVRPYKSA